MDLDSKIAQINDRLKAALIRVRLRRKGDKLYLRATYPPKPGENTPKQRDLSLGINASIPGLKYAEAKAKEIGGLLDSDRFSWSTYLDTPVLAPTPKTQSKTTEDWILEFEKDYFTTRQRTPTKLNTYKKEYGLVFSRLPKEAKLTCQLLRETVLNYSQPETRSRKRFAICCQKLADFAGVDCDLRKLAGNYNYKSAAPRKLPSDQQILEQIPKITDLNWQFAYKLLATFGIRPHELLYVNCDRLSEGILGVEQGKGLEVSKRLVFACPSYWIEDLSLSVGGNIPHLWGRNNNEKGARVSMAFRKFGIDFTPYYLRHCYAVRTATLGVDVAIAARWMGHSVDLHTQTYHAYLQEKHHARAYELMKKMEDLGRDS